MKKYNLKTNWFALLVVGLTVLLPNLLFAANRVVAGSSQWVAQLPCQQSAQEMAPSIYHPGRIYGLCDDRSTFFIVDTKSEPASVTSRDLTKLRPDNDISYRGLVEISPTHLVQSWEESTEEKKQSGLSMIDLKKSTVTNYSHPPLLPTAEQANTNLLSSLPKKIIPLNSIGMNYLSDNDSLFIGFSDLVSAQTLEKSKHGVILQYYFEPDSATPQLINYRILSDPLARMTLAGSSGKAHLVVMTEHFANVNSSAEYLVGWLNPYVKLMVQQGLHPTPKSLASVFNEKTLYHSPVLIPLPKNGDGLAAFFNTTTYIDPDSVDIKKEGGKIAMLNTAFTYFLPLLAPKFEDDVQDMFSNGLTFNLGTSAASQHGIFLAHEGLPFVRSFMTTGSNLKPQTTYFGDTLFFADPSCDEPQSMTALAEFLKNPQAGKAEVACQLSISAMVYTDGYLYAARNLSLLRIKIKIPNPFLMNKYKNF